MKDVLIVVEEELVWYGIIVCGVVEGFEIVDCVVVVDDDVEISVVFDVDCCCFEVEYVM